MPSKIEIMAHLAYELGYTTFTPLQKRAFTKEETYDAEQNLFITGATSTGKTLIPCLIYLYYLEKAKKACTDYPKMLFVVPYRALAKQKLVEMQHFFSSKELIIVQSTGEFRQDDENVQSANVDIAVIITEKVYKYTSRDATFLSKYDLLVLDEIGLIDSDRRGVRLDFILSWATINRMHSRPRIIALGTPFYDWSKYIDKYKLIEIKESTRPISLDEYIITYTKGGITEASINPADLHRTLLMTKKQFDIQKGKYGIPSTRCEFNPQRCPLQIPCRNNTNINCDITQNLCIHPIEWLESPIKSTQEYILYHICQTHLLQGHQILIFFNNRTEVRNYAKKMLFFLKERGLLPECKDVIKCKQEVLSQCRIDEEDAYGLLEEENEDGHLDAEWYEALACGIGFHSAALPNEIRTYVENKFLNTRELKIVFSTETLAFGVNSAVDVVVVANIKKNENGTSRFLTLNEYKNYIGRAGRKNKGYVYTLIKEKPKSVKLKC